MYQKSFGVVISEREAYEIGLRLIRLVRVVYGSQERDEPETSYADEFRNQGEFNGGLEKLNN
ncbi:MAG: hypothetical protein UX65_C0002G0009 [Parcubacteria group bacterium GW2011_GWB1_46_8]|nr:MAG: hypothetical protein UX65_C0002G0009 [Parcubacteria group bacterium GW2011_GWB1_46_8]